MATKKEEWILASEAANIMTRNSGHPVSTSYVRLLAGRAHNKIRSRMRDGRTREYHRGDVEEYRVERKSKRIEDDGQDHQGGTVALVG